MEKSHGVLVMNLLEMLQFLVLIIVHHVILILEKLKALMIAMAQQKKKFSINFSKTNTKLCFSLHCPGDESYLYVNKT